MPAEERTEPASPRRRQEARRKGQVGKSQEITSAFIILIGFFALWLYGPRMFNYLQSYMIWILSPLILGHMPLNEPNVEFLFMDMMAFCARVLAPILIILFIIGILSNVLQVGLTFSTDVLQPNLSKLNPISGFSRLFSLRSITELIKSLFKVFLVSYVAYTTVKGMLGEFIQMADVDLITSNAILGKSIITLALKVAAVFIILAILDYIYQKYEFEKSIRMTKQEVKDEFKQREGDPLVKSRIRQKQREFAMRRMMKDVPKADVVITNPVHIAIALQYDAAIMNAPRVIAKGAGDIAERIKQIAKDNNIPIMEDKPLAHALFKLTDIGDFVPPSLFKAIAEILAYVYRLGKKQHKFGI